MILHNTHTYVNVNLLNAENCSSLIAFVVFTCCMRLIFFIMQVVLFYFEHVPRNGMHFPYNWHCVYNCSFKEKMHKNCAKNMNTFPDLGPYNEAYDMGLSVFECLFFWSVNYNCSKLNLVYIMFMLNLYFYYILSL